jgi:hypothetical protein
MLMPQTLYPDPFHEEERYYLHAGLADIHFARSMLRRVGADEHRRFNDVGFAYGDSSMMGYSPYEVYEEQLSNVLYTLFGDGYTGDLMTIALYDDEEKQMLRQISQVDGGPLNIIGDVDPFHPLMHGDCEEALVTEIRTFGAFQSHHTGPPGPANTSPTARQRLDGLATALRAATGESGNPALHRWRHDSNVAEQLRQTDSCTDTLLFVHGAEPFYPHDIFHEVIFERLIAAWKHWPDHVVPRTDRRRPSRNLPFDT